MPRPRHVSSTVGEPLMVTSLKFNIYIRQETFETYMHFVLPHSSLGLHLCPFGTTKRSNATTLVMNFGPRLAEEYEFGVNGRWFPGFCVFSTHRPSTKQPNTGPRNTSKHLCGCLAQRICVTRPVTRKRWNRSKKARRTCDNSIELHLSQGLEVRLEWCFGCCFGGL